MKLKRILMGTIVSLMGLTLSSCLLKNKDLIINKDLSYTFTKEDEEELRSDMERFEGALKGEDSTDLIGAWNKINRTAYAIATFRTIEYLNYCSHGANYKSKSSDEMTCYEKYSYYIDLVNEVIMWQEGMYDDIYNSSWKDSFFEGMTQGEIDELLNSVKPSEYYELESANEELLKQYRDLNASNFESSVKDIYLSLVKNYNDEAKLLNYSNYREYSYDNIYSRDYTPDEVDDFYGYVKDYIVPLLKEYGDYEATEECYNYFDTLFTRRIGSEDNSYITKYIDYVGGGMKENYNFLLKDGYYFVGQSDLSLDHAFTTYLYVETLDQPCMYFGPSYQDTMTFIHEFGHYNAYCYLGASDLSYDLAETHSQGNEMLYRAWIEKKVATDSSLKNEMRARAVGDVANTILRATIIDLFEKFVYEDDNLEKDELDTYYRNAVSYFGDYNEIMNLIYGDYTQMVDYWKLVCLENPCYYISYAMSDIPTLEIYSSAISDLDGTIAKYNKLYDLPELLSGSDFLQVLDYAGFYTPFEEKTYELISSL